MVRHRIGAIGWAQHRCVTDDGDDAKNREQTGCLEDGQPLPGFLNASFVSPNPAENHRAHHHSNPADRRAFLVQSVPKTQPLGKHDRGGSQQDQRLQDRVSQRPAKREPPSPCPEGQRKNQGDH